jgi:hypothetical protein
MSYKDLDENQLGEAYHKIAMDLSYLNAAEGQSWSAETKLRYACQATYKEICQEYKDRGLEIPKGNYLI